MVERTHTDLYGKVENPIGRISVTPPDTWKEGNAKAVVEILQPTIRVEDLFAIAEKAAAALGKHYPNSELPTWAQRPTAEEGPRPDPKADHIFRLDDKAKPKVAHLLLAYSKAIFGLYQLGEEPLGDAVRMVAAGFTFQLMQAVGDDIKEFGPSPLMGLMGFWKVMDAKEGQDEKSGHTGEGGV